MPIYTTTTTVRSSYFLLDVGNSTNEDSRNRIVLFYSNILSTLFNGKASAMRKKQVNKVCVIIWRI
jgi:hypothetical protein